MSLMPVLLFIYLYDDDNLLIFYLFLVIFRGNFSNSFGIHQV